MSRLPSQEGRGLPLEGVDDEATLLERCHAASLSPHSLALEEAPQPPPERLAPDDLDPIEAHGVKHRHHRGGVGSDPVRHVTSELSAG